MMKTTPRTHLGFAFTRDDLQIGAATEDT